MKKIITLVGLLGVFSCHRYSGDINNALKMAGENKDELIRVLDHYEQGKNPEKLEAAKFLISNLPYNYAYDTTHLDRYRTVLDTAWSQWEQTDHVDATYLNKLWDSLKIVAPTYRNVYSLPIHEDIKVITADFLIKNIENAYKTWKTNPYSRDSVNFQDFCEYVLPYRQIQGKAIENWREFFMKNNKNHFRSSYPIPFTTACDSLFEQYKKYKFDYWLLQGFPILKFRDFMKVKSGNCVVKSWFNTYLVNAEGIPMATDFVPAWGSREDDHQWNALIYGGKALYFESFWEKGHDWMYNPNINNNLFDDDWSGKIRLPKVYRNTYSTHIEGPISDSRVALKNIPMLFRNVKKMDVSDQYFKTVDVNVKFSKAVPSKTYYAYLCVLGVNKQWIPVQWGKIDGDIVTFSKMGADIVYQPVFYKNGLVIPCSKPFHLGHDGHKTFFSPQEKLREVVLKRKYPAKRGLVKEAKLIKGSQIQASNDKNFRHFATLGKVGFEPELRPYSLEIAPKKKYRYFRLFSKNMIAVKEIELFSPDLKSLGGTFISSAPTRLDSVTTWKGIDIGSPKEVSRIAFSPRNNINHVLEGLTYELFYVDDGKFVSLGRKKAESYELIFDNVPEGALLYLKCVDEGRQERIFEYRNGKQIWY